MAVKIIPNQQAIVAGEESLLSPLLTNRLTLEIDNGDLAKLRDMMNKWNFKDEQSFFRFVITIMLVTEDKFLAIKVKDEITPIKPSAEYVKGE